MRIALVCDWFLPRFGGIELQLRDLAQALSAHGHDVVVITTTAGDAVIDGVRVERLNTALLPGSGVAVSPGLRRRTLTMLKNGSFDLIHAHASIVSPLAYAGALAGAELNVPTVLTFHSMLHATSLLLGASESLIGWSRDRILLTAVSSIVAAQAARWMAHADVAILPNGIAADFWNTNVARKKGDGPAEVVFASAMRLTRKKRPLELIDAMAGAISFLAGSPPLRLVLAGEGAYRDVIHRRAADAGIAARVDLCGLLSREQLRDLYARSDAFILPSERESFGIAALEACAAGLPVIARVDSGVRDFVVDGVNGLLTSNVRSMTSAIVRLVLDAPFREYSRHANRSAARMYDWPVVVNRHLEVYAAAAALTRARNAGMQR